MNAIILLSGGLDSQVLLANARHQFDYIHCIGFDYGQKHSRELKHAYQIAHYYGATFEVIKLPELKGSCLTDDREIPKGLHYEDPRQVITVVPNRNGVMLSVAASVAAKMGYKLIEFACHVGDAKIYPDCRPLYIASLSKATFLSCGVSIAAPFIDLRKKEIVELGRKLKVPLEDSWSCYEEGETPCEECGACIERKEALT